jgi:hypothetical protein
MAGRSIEVHANIAAPLDTVWEILVDFARYYEWNPFLERVDTTAKNPLEVGSRIILHARYGAGRLIVCPEEIAAVAPPYDGAATLVNRYVSVVTRVGLFQAVRTQVLTATGPAATRYLSTARFSGLLAPITRHVLSYDLIRSGITTQTEALRRRSESRHSRSS